MVVHMLRGGGNSGVNKLWKLGLNIFLFVFVMYLSYCFDFYNLFYFVI